jgi:selenocysteine-specific elongation factor
MTNLPDKQLENHLQHLMSQQTIIQTDRENRVFIHKATFDTLKEKINEYLGNYHRANPLKAGMPKEELKSKFPLLGDSKVFNLVIIQMVKDEQIIQEEKTVRLASHEVSLGRDQADIKDGIIKIYLTGGLQPPYFRDVVKELGVSPNHAKDVLMLLVEEGQIVKTKDDLYFHARAVDELKSRLVAFLKANGEIDTPQFKEMTGVSRKYVIPLIEYFDSNNVTLRVGDRRMLRKSS